MAFVRKRYRTVFSRFNAKTAILALITPFTAYLLMQFVLGAQLSDFSLHAMVGNAVCIGAVYALLTAIIGNIGIASLVCHIMFGVWAAANSFVFAFRGTPVLPWDFMALGTAAAVAGSYDPTPDPRMIVGLVLAVCGIIALIKFRPPFLRLRGRLFSLAVSAALCFLVGFTPLLSGATFKPDVWSQMGSYRKGGAAAVFLRNFDFMEIDQPESPTLDQLQTTVDSLPADPTPVSEQVPNVIAIMNESWADFEEFGNLTLSEPVNEYISSLPNSIWGHCYTSVFGAGTSASEFEFLTGNSMAFLPSGSIPYQQYILSPSSSMASAMKANGYRTVAIHPGERTSWQRNSAYPLLGFDTFKPQTELDVPIKYERQYISDETSFDQIIWEYENKQPNEKLFVFNVTIQNHGGYTEPDYPAQVTVTGANGEYPKAEQYLTLAAKTDDAFRNLVEYFEQQDEPTIILMFGDHQPNVEEEFLDMAYGLTGDGMTMEQYMGKFRTPFVIWANYPLPDSQLNDPSLNFLGLYLMRYAGIEPSSYAQYLWNLQKTLPAVTFVGYTDPEGNAYSHLETNDFAALIQEYQAFQYNNLFGKTQRINEWFSPVPVL